GATATASIAFDATAAAVKAAIELAVPAVTATVTGSDGGPYSVSLTGATGALTAMGATVAVV
ncbi:MAG TPA: hypothetical protein PLZ58_04130, partial [Candidatus Saccharibacteria bacterium]|nr:hypothetical protein [Candidatus Saccharibacteria bacterium]